MNNFAEKPIEFNYPAVTPKLLTELTQKQTPIALTSKDPFILKNSYYLAGLTGTQKTIYTRQAVADRLHKIATHLLAFNAQLIIFDAFRTIATQRAIFDQFLQTIKAELPHLSDQEAWQKARQYAFYPDGTSVPPHNSGGAIDLAIVDKNTQQLWDFGGEFDELHSVSTSNYYEAEFDAASGLSQERWYHIRRNRRILFHLMLQQGFTNYEAEWWHYDLGSQFWCRRHNIDPIYLSMEDFRNKG